ncbi:MAG: hypothetical protein U0992_07255 [Planctomycetaceae bacterium]
MWVDVSLLVTLLGDDNQRRAAFSRALERRGWSTSAEAPDAYRVAIQEPSGDEEIVQICARDVQDSAYVAGVAHYQATCLIAADALEPAGEACESDADEDAWRATRFDSDDA